VSAITVHFAFRPGDWVTITAYGLNYRGRVQRCSLNPHDRMVYEVEFAADGKLDRHDFAADELELATEGA
jgi:hypothetical protein